MTVQTDGFLNLLKPPGMTSHDAVAKVRRLFGTRSVGHAGTLDPAATGVLPIAIGKATRLLEYTVESDKTYIGEVLFGIETDTLDQCGQIVARLPAELSQGELEDAMAAMLGAQLQSPPAFSAVKHEGKPLYAYARQGQCIVKPGRPIEVSRFRLTHYYPGRYPRCLFHLDCSKGTYVRVLVRDLARRLGTTATLIFLLRARVGELAVEDAVTFEELQLESDRGCLAARLLPVETAIKHLPTVVLVGPDCLRFVSGQTVFTSSEAIGLCGVLGAGRLLGVGVLAGDILKPHKVLTSREDIARWL